MKHIIYISIIFSMMVAPVLAQTKSHLCNLFNINGETYLATSITLKDNATQLAIEDITKYTIPTQHPQDETPITIDGKAIYCVAGTLTADLVKKAASTGQFIIYGSINDADCNNIKNNMNGAKSIKFINIDGKQVTSSLEEILKDSGASSVTFENCNFSEATTLQIAFAYMSNLTSISLKGMGLTNKLTNLYGMFYVCTALKSIDFSNCDLSSVTSYGYMFHRCTALKEIKAIGCNEGTIAFLKARLNDAGLKDKVQLIVE